MHFKALAMQEVQEQAMSCIKMMSSATIDRRFSRNGWRHSIPLPIAVYTTAHDRCGPCKLMLPKLAEV